MAIEAVPWEVTSEKMMEMQLTVLSQHSSEVTEKRTRSTEWGKVDI
jgi:hypothetical protein